MDKGAPAVIETELGRDALLARIDELLEARYRSVDLGNVDDRSPRRSGGGGSDSANGHVG
jgi:hypothetical protein